MDGNAGVDNPNYETFREYVSQALIHRSAEAPSKTPSRRKKKGTTHLANSEKSPLTELETNDPEELAEFIDVCTHIQTVHLPENTY